MYAYQREATEWWDSLQPPQQVICMRKYSNTFKYYIDTASKLIYMYKQEVIYKDLKF